ncbi:hypothetical protein C8R43DRAFT_1127113 [Mycena crocata]|nr:hypothetical protein C8R43DRAFT_1127113 [Mycena crocata]
MDGEALDLPTLTFHSDPYAHPELAGSPPTEPPQLARLIDLMDQQLYVLRIDQRQAAADFSQQPIPEVPASNSSAWNALLGSTLKDIIEPRVERWRSGLDALLVFVNSVLGRLDLWAIRDKTARTNELLVNLTDVMISLSGKPSSGLNLTYPVPFRPDPSIVRVNAFWSLALTFSLAIAALAVGSRGFLNMIAWSQHQKASERLADIWTRWNAANSVLNLLFSSVNELRTPPPFILFAFGLSVLCITVVAALLCFTVIDASIHSASSPFQSKLAYSIHSSLVPTLKSYASWVRCVCLPHRALPSSKLDPNTMGPISSNHVDAGCLPASTNDLYHRMVQLTHEDASLDQAAGALFNVIHERAGSPSHGHVRITSQECTTLRHLLSPEASIRSNRIAAWVIVPMQTVDARRSIIYSPASFGPVLASLAGAAKRSGGGYPLATLWDSPFIRAMAVMLLDEDRDSIEHPLVVHCLSSSYSAWDELRFGTLQYPQLVFSFLLDILYAKLHEELPVLVDKSEARIVDVLLSPRFSLAAVPVSIDSQNFMRSLMYRSPTDHRRELTHLVRWVIKVSSAPHVIRFYLRTLEDMSTLQAKALTWAQCGSLFAIVDTVARLCLEPDDVSGSAPPSLPPFESWDLLSDLCATCLVKFITSRHRLGIAAFSFDLTLTFLNVLRNFRPSPTSMTFRYLPIIFRYVHDTPHLRYGEVLAEFQTFLDVVGFKNPADLREADERSLAWTIGDNVSFDG